jgi:hypothetical protein
MRASRRRSRTLDSLANPSTIRAICEKLRERLPELIPTSEKQLMRFLYAVRHVERRPATNTQKGRPSRWPREELMKAASQLRSLLERETSGRVSLNSFIGQYLPIIEFPSDVTDALCAGRINLQEAAQLARLTPERLNCSPRAARECRTEVLQSHLAMQGSQTRLRARVKELLGESKQLEISEGLTSVVSKVDELLEVDPADTRHMFWEEMKRLFFAMREIEPEDLDEELMDDFLQAMDGVSNVLNRIEKRRQARAQAAKKLVI